MRSPTILRIRRATPRRRSRRRYAKVLGSAVNPVLREGNSDRRVATSVKQYAKSHPHSMGAWSSGSRSHVSSMAGGDFYANEQSAVISQAGKLTIELTDANGKATVLKDGVAVTEGDVIGTSMMSRRALTEFFAREIGDAKDKGVLLSLHLKATMMKVSDPIMFGHAVTAYYKDVFDKHAATFESLGVDPDNGIGDVYKKIQALPAETARRHRSRSSGGLRDASCACDGRFEQGDHQSSRAERRDHRRVDAGGDPRVGPDVGPRRQAARHEGDDSRTACYAGIYQATIDDCRQHGAFDVRTMGTVSNVGLMAQSAEEYGSHDKTFEIPSDGTVRVSDASGQTLFEHTVEEGDIWRMCRTRDLPIRDWVKLAVTRARATGHAAIFWLDEKRAYDRNVIEKARRYLKDHDTSGLDIQILSPIEAIRATLKRVRAGLDTISVTGNVLRDYLTDLFPILELGTSAKMLSIVPLLDGGGLYETGAGGSAPKHVQQFLQENYLRWDSLGEYLALAVSIEDLGTKTGNRKALVVADALDRANGKILDNDKSPQRKVGELDNRGSHFYLAMYWARALADQAQDNELRASVRPHRKPARAAGGDDRLRAEWRARQAGRDRRLLSPRSGEDVEGDAAERHAQRHHRPNAWIAYFLPMNLLSSAIGTAPRP